MSELLRYEKRSLPECMNLPKLRSTPHIRQSGKAQDSHARESAAPVMLSCLGAGTKERNNRTLRKNYGNDDEIGREGNYQGSAYPFFWRTGRASV
jgi:hypothetical protein